MLFKFNKKEEKPTKRTLKVYSPNEVVKAGGADRFARKIGHTPLTKRTDVPTIDFTEKEWEEVQQILRDDK